MPRRKGERARRTDETPDLEQEDRDAEGSALSPLARPLNAALWKLAGPPPKTWREMVNIYGGPGRGGGTKRLAERLHLTPRTIQRYLAAESGSAKEQRPQGAEAERISAVRILRSVQWNQLRLKIAARGLRVQILGVYMYSARFQNGIPSWVPIDEPVIPPADLEGFTIAMGYRATPYERALLFEPLYWEYYGLPGAFWHEVDECNLYLPPDKQPETKPKRKHKRTTPPSKPAA